MAYGRLRDDSAEALSVTAALGIAKGTLEGIRVKIIGEVSELTDKSGYKAVYFSLKDKSSTMKCLIWKNVYEQMGVRLYLGALVEVTGRFSLNPKKGSMSFNVTGIELAGEGYLRMQVANLAKKLQAEGLMNPARKRRMPHLPERIGLVTSPRGAAVHDVLRTLRRRYPLGRVMLAGVPVEGAQAVENIIGGIRVVVEAGAEVVLVVRGGGQYEDFMPFNDERLARVIASCPVPVVTGIGHEPDNTIADMVADVRQSTPTGAAEHVAPDTASLRLHLDSMLSSMTGNIHVDLSRRRQRIASVGSVMAGGLRARLTSSRLRLERIALTPLFAEPQRLFEDEAESLDALTDRLRTALPRVIERDRSSLARTENFLKRSLPGLCTVPVQRVSSLRTRLAISLPKSLEAYSQRTSVLGDRLAYLGPRITQSHAHEMSLAAARLHSLSPLTVIARGYAFAEDKQGKVVKSVDALVPGESIKVTVADGVLGCRVESTQKIDMAIGSWEDCDE